MPKGGKEKFHQTRDHLDRITLTKKDTEAAKNLDRHKREVNSSLVEKGSTLSPRSRRKVSNSVANFFNTQDLRFPKTKNIQVTPGEWKTKNNIK